MDEKMSRELYSDIRSGVEEQIIHVIKDALRLGSIVPEEHYLDDIMSIVLDAVNIKVEPPPILPGVSIGSWTHEAQASGAFKVVVNGMGGIAYHMTEPDARVMAASQEMAEAMVECVKIIDGLILPDALFCKIRKTLALPLEKAIGKAW